MAIASASAHADPFPPIFYGDAGSDDVGTINGQREIQGATSLPNAIGLLKDQLAETLVDGSHPLLPKGTLYTLTTVYAEQTGLTTYRIEYKVSYRPPNANDPVLAEVSIPDGDLVANAISGNLTVVGRYATDNGAPSAAFPGSPYFGAFMWTPSGGLKALPFAYALGVSDDGSVIVGGTSTTDLFDFNQIQEGSLPYSGHAVRYTAALGVQDLGALNGAGGISVAISTNSDGTVVVGNSTRATGFVNTDPTLDATLYLTTKDAVRWDITNPQTGAFTMTDLGHLPDKEQVDSYPTQYADRGFSAATAVSADGSTVVGFGNTANPDGGVQVQTHAMMWTKGGSGPTDLGTLSGLTTSQATAVSGNGAIIVGYAYGQPNVDVTTTTPVIYGGPNNQSIPSESRAFRWTAATGMQNLNTLLTNAGVNLGGGVLLNATAISADGSLIAGQAVEAGSPNGTYVTSYFARYIDAAVVATATAPTGPTTPTGPTGPTTPIAGLTDTASVQASVDQLARQRTRLMIMGRSYVSPITDDGDRLLAPTEAHAFVAGDDVNGGFRGRLNFHDLMLLGGVSWGSQTFGQVQANGVTSGTLALRYAPTLFSRLFGNSRPFAEVGYFASHADGSRFTRTYDNGDGEAAGSGGGSINGSAVYGRLGWIWTPNPADQFGVYAEYGHQRQSFGAYVEPLTTENPFEAAVDGGAVSQDVARLGVRYSHDPARGFAWGFNATAGHGFNTDTGLTVAIPGIGGLAADPHGNPTWFEYTARFGYVVAQHLTLSAFVTGIAGSQLGGHAHPGLDLRWVF